MNRQFFVRVLLSLLLLLSQQMAMSHATTHWAGSRDGAAQLQKSGGEQSRGVGAAFAKHQTCEQCLAFAQIASAVGSSPLCFAFDRAAVCASGPTATEPGGARTTCVFQPRAPPSLA